MQVEELMKSPQGCREGQTAQECARLMQENNIGFVPICNQAGQPVGAITDRDLCIRVLAAGKAPSTKIEEVMTRDVVSCTLGDDVGQAERLMRDHRKSRIMVCGQDGKLAGVISLSDVADLDSAESAGRTLKEVAARESQQPHAS